jgi:hypothetical protein
MVGAMFGLPICLVPTRMELKSWSERKIFDIPTEVLYSLVSNFGITEEIFEVKGHKSNTLSYKRLQMLI